MRHLTTAELLQVWEDTLGYPTLQRDLSLLKAACPEYGPTELVSLPIGKRDGLLLTLREWIFGTRLTALADCPECGTRAELEMSTEQIRVVPQPDLPTEHEIEADGAHIRFRLPDGRDLAALATRQPDVDGRSFLLERCILSVQTSDGSVSNQHLPRALVLAVIEAMARLDSQADIRLELSCPACGKQWSEPFSIGTFFWEELQHWALRLLGDVHTLASAYGWREVDILSMGWQRRQFYLQMIAHE